MEFHIGQNKTTCVVPAGYLNRAMRRKIKKKGGQIWRVK